MHVLAPSRQVWGTARTKNPKHPVCWRIYAVNWKLGKDPSPSGIQAMVMAVSGMELSPRLHSLFCESYRSMHFWRTLTIVSVPKKSHPTELFSRINITGAETTSFPTSLPTKPSSKKTLTSQWSSSPHVVHQFSQQETTDIKGKRSKASFRHTIRPLRWGSGGADAEGSSRNILVVVVG